MPFQPSLLGRGSPAGAPLRAVAGRAFARRRATHNQHTQCATARRRVRGFYLPISDGTNPSPVVLRLVKAPEADTLCPRERAGSRAWDAPTICRNEPGMSMKTKPNAKSARSRGRGLVVRVGQPPVPPLTSCALALARGGKAALYSSLDAAGVVGRANGLVLKAKD
jgi:hypothetical protein